jgi:hypothetical protein
LIIKYLDKNKVQYAKQKMKNSLALLQGNSFELLRLFREQQTEKRSCKLRLAHDILLCVCLAKKTLGRYGASGS